VRRILIGVTALSVIGLMAVATAPQALAKTHNIRAAKIVRAVHGKRVVAHDPTIYDSIIDPNPGNVPSQSFEATGTEELGNQVSFGGVARVLDSVAVQMSSWACQSGSWTGTPSACATTPGATFSVPITFNIFGVGPASADGPSTAGPLLATDTQTFNIPYRPSSDPNYATDCLATATADSLPVSDFQYTWYDAGLNKCFNGDFTDISFTFGHVTLPNSVIYGITFNTNTSGLHPLGYSGPADSLNVALSQEPSSPSVGSDTYQGTVYTDIHDGGYQSNYCDGGAAGISVFRIDEPTGYPTNNGTNSGCWSVSGNTAPWYIPAVQFNALNSPSPTINSVNSFVVTAGKLGSPWFTVTTTGVPTPTVVKVAGKLPKGLVFTRNSGGTATISGTALKTDRDRVYAIVVLAKNARNSSARQRLSITLTGGKS